MLFLVAEGFNGAGQRDSGMCEGPEIPVGHLAIEPFVQGVTGESFLPGLVQPGEVVEMIFVVQDGQREVTEDIDVGADRIGKVEILDKRDLFQHVLGLVAFVEAAVYDGERERVAMPEQEQDRHWEQSVNRAGDCGKFGPRIGARLQFEGEKQVALDDGVPEFAFRLERRQLVAERGGADFFICDLEQKIHGLPLGEEGVIGIQRFLFGERGNEAFGGVRLEREALLAAVAKRFEERGGGFGQRSLRETCERFDDGLLHDERSVFLLMR
ncbi:MAG: hypothetical protein L0Z50_32430 [Verrucomicrobiales bacterium]|nr:hypothetical protein [Verrucomicrobiales bacterium]